MHFLDIVRYFGALFMVLALVGLAGLALRRYGMPGVVKAGNVRRLSVTETLMVGAKHKLFLIKRDGVEHLVLVGPQGACVVEEGIPAAAAQTSIASLSSVADRAS